MIWMAVVPAGERSRADDAWQLLAGNSKLSVPGRAGGEHDRVVQWHQFVEPNIAPYFDVAKKVDALARQHAVKHARDRLRALMVRRDPVTNEPERRRKPLENVDGGIGKRQEQLVGQITPRGTAADDGNVKH